MAETIPKVLILTLYIIFNWQKHNILQYYTVTGLAHNPESGNNKKSFPHGQGYLIEGKDGIASSGAQTIMAIKEGQKNANFYSNPRVTYPPTGTKIGISATADNARVLTEQRYDLADIGDESDFKCRGQ